MFMLLSTIRGRLTMWEVAALILAMLLVIAVGAVSMFVFFFAVERLQDYGREEND
jgi:Na+/glutamate symporter